MGRRARTDEDKAKRRQSILDSARTLLGNTRYDDIRMAQIARHCGVAKGTLYLYFPSKEDLFLELLEREYQRWFDDIEVSLDALESASPEGVCTVLVESLAHREMLFELVPLLHSVLEQNIEYETALAFKQKLVAQVARFGAQLEALLPTLRPGQGAMFALRLQICAQGMIPHAKPSPVVAEVLEHPSLQVLNLPFAQTLHQVLVDLLHGMIAAHADPLK